jgi:hypothetical protein
VLFVITTGVDVEAEAIGRYVFPYVAVIGKEDVVPTADTQKDDNPLSVGINENALYSDTFSTGMSYPISTVVGISVDVTT